MGEIDASQLFNEIRRRFLWTAALSALGTLAFVHRHAPSLLTPALRLGIGPGLVVVGTTLLVAGGLVWWTSGAVARWLVRRALRQCGIAVPDAGEPNGSKAQQ